MFPEGRSVVEDSQTLRGDKKGPFNTTLSACRIIRSLLLSESREAILEKPVKQPLIEVNQLWRFVKGRTLH